MIPRATCSSNPTVTSMAIVVVIERKVSSSIRKITVRLTTVIRMTVLLPLSPISATIAAPPVTYALIPGGAGVRATMSWTNLTDSFPMAWPG